MAIFDHANPKIFESTFSFPEFVKISCKKCKKITLFHLFIFERQSILDSCDQTSHTHFWPCPLRKIFDQLLIFVNLYQHAKNWFIPSVYSLDTVNFRVPSTHPITIFEHAHLKNFQSRFNLHEFVPVCKKISWSHLSDLRYSQF